MQINANLALKKSPKIEWKCKQFSEHDGNSQQPAGESFTVAMQLIHLQSCRIIRAHAIGSLRPPRSLRPPLPSVNIFSSSPIGSEQAKGRPHLINGPHPPQSALPSANYSPEESIFILKVGRHFQF